MKGMHMLKRELNTIRKAGLEINPIPRAENQPQKWRVNRPNAPATQFKYFDADGVRELAAACKAGDIKTVERQVPPLTAAREREIRRAAQSETHLKKATAKGASGREGIFTKSGAFRTVLTANPNRFRRWINRELREHIKACKDEAKRFQRMGANDREIKRFLKLFQAPAQKELSDRLAGRVVRLGRAAMPDSTPDSQLPPVAPVKGQDTGLKVILKKQREERQKKTTKPKRKR